MNAISQSTSTMLSATPFDAKSQQQAAAVARGRELAMSGPNEAPAEDIDREAVREAFNDFVGQTFYGQMMQAMRKSLGKPAYFHGGKGEEVFQSQLDQIIGERMTEANGGDFADAMFELQFPGPQTR